MSSVVPALLIEDLSKRFGRILAVDRLSLEVVPGRMVGFLGPNGAGKSTTLYMIARLVRPSSGQIRIFDLDLFRDFKEAVRSVGVVVETPAFYDGLTGRKNLELAANLRGGIPARQIDEILERIGLAERGRDKVRTYSLGMKQRLGIGRALLGNPRLLILDEPTNGMDPEGTQEILTFLKGKVRTEGLTVFVSSHLLHEVEEYCDTVHVIDKGRLVASGEVREILRPRDGVVRVTFAGRRPDPADLLGDDRIAEVTDAGADALEFTLRGGNAVWLNRHLLARGHPVSALAPRQMTLKDFFLSITGDSRRA
jgi:ABC-2 type transport system ATP-binding protein